ncbi:MAG TPA: radical SAM protein [Phycisphaerae bacterium]|nr:radical SAM protein [Phycisphaerae bacterium]
MCLYPYPKDQDPGIGIFPPTGLEYVATALKGHVGRISLIDLRHEQRFQSPARMSDFIRADVDLVCVSVYWKARFRQVCEYIRQLPSDRTIIVGGREASNNTEDILERCGNVNAVVRGEGEQTIQELADGRPWEHILGLSYRRNGQIVHNPNRPLQPIGDIAPPDRSLRRSRYFPTLRGVRLLPMEFDTVLGSRGCPYKCDFCTFSLNPLGQKRDYVARSPESVVDEIEACPGKMILFADDNFFLDHRRVERICDLLAERGIDKRYFANARIEAARHPQVLEKAYRTGFRMLLLGIESANDRTLLQLGKGFTTEQVREAFQVLRRLPFFYHGYFIYGNVGETEDEMLAIADFARELGVHSIGLSKLRVDKYTPLRKLVESMPGYRISPNGSVYSPDFDNKRLRRVRNRIRNGFMRRPGQLARLLSMLNECEILTYPQMARLSLATPLFLWDYIAGRGSKRLRRLRDRLAHQKT